MITINPECRGYKVKFSDPGLGTRGFSERTKDLDQVHILIDHYHNQPHDKSNCLFCQRIERTEKVEKEFRDSDSSTK